MVEQGYKYLDCQIQSMKKFLETRIENLKNQFLQVFPQEAKNRKTPRKEKL